VQHRWYGERFWISEATGTHLGLAPFICSWCGLGVMGVNGLQWSDLILRTELMNFSSLLEKGSANGQHVVVDLSLLSCAFASVDQACGVVICESHLHVVASEGQSRAASLRPYASNRPVGLLSRWNAG
jgi:hypothetical protein